MVVPRVVFLSVRQYNRKFFIFEKNIFIFISPGIFPVNCRTPIEGFVSLGMFDRLRIFGLVVEIFLAHDLAVFYDEVPDLAKDVPLTAVVEREIALDDDRESARADERALGDGNRVDRQPALGQPFLVVDSPSQPAGRNRHPLELP